METSKTSSVVIIIFHFVVMYGLGDLERAAYLLVTVSETKICC